MLNLATQLHAQDSKDEEQQKQQGPDVGKRRQGRPEGEEQPPQTPRVLDEAEHPHDAENPEDLGEILHRDGARASGAPSQQPRLGECQPKRYAIHYGGLRLTWPMVNDVGASAMSRTENTTTTKSKRFHRSEMYPYQLRP